MTWLSPQAPLLATMSLGYVCEKKNVCTYHWPCLLDDYDLLAVTSLCNDLFVFASSVVQVCHSRITHQLQHEVQGSQFKPPPLTAAGGSFPLGGCRYEPPSRVSLTDGAAVSITAGPDTVGGEVYPLAGIIAEATGAVATGQVEELGSRVNSPRLFGPPLPPSMADAADDLPLQAVQPLPDSTHTALSPVAPLPAAAAVPLAAPAATAVPPTNMDSGGSRHVGESWRKVAEAGARERSTVPEVIPERSMYAVLAAPTDHRIYSSNGSENAFGVMGDAGSMARGGLTDASSTCATAALIAVVNVLGGAPKLDNSDSGQFYRPGCEKTKSRSLCLSFKRN